ncbi:hypothetical protein RGUI_1858 [Rhodovulum sp. P5]|uniref:DUF4177 domain-containing protein n=1 Tax=Rhodovulum sp. P5 TaxID=1564506 RepID=UPI0009C1B536|nr:DUF4177 domain-containing protein [Rhodovulum sp. P5]ARE39999.1 hypothetical protein RGUI_1858 [Rhodovulum sp. P5]
MGKYEYKVMPAPERGRRVRGAKTTADRFAHVVEDTLNAMAAEGWEFLRAETLPCEERKGLTGRSTSYQNLLVFRRDTAAAAKTPDSPEQIAEAAAAAVHRDIAPSPRLRLGPASQEPRLPRPMRPLGPADRDD